MFFCNFSGVFLMSLFDFFNFFFSAHNEKRPEDAALCGRSERLKSGTDTQLCLSDVYKDGTRAKRRQADVPLCGRSMVEMLGVLAIIGVLSVGAMSGYAKAMFKYKLNRQAEAFNMLLNNAIQIKPEFDRAFTGHEVFAGSIFNQLNLIPDGMTYDAQKKRIYDVFDTETDIAYYNANNGNIVYVMEISLARSGNKISRDSIEICRNLITTAQASSSDIYRLGARAGQNNGNTYSQIDLYGDSICYSGRTCLRDADLEKINEVCSSCESESYCKLIIYLMIKKYE